MSRPSVDLEAAAIAALANLAAVDTKAALEMLDAAGTQAQDFAGKHAAALWAVLEAVLRDGRQPDLIALAPKVPQVPREYLTRVLMSDETANPRERLRAVRDAGQRRRAGEVLGRVRSLILEPSRPLPEAVAEAIKALEAVKSSESASETLDADVLAMCDRLDEIASGRREAVLPTGIEALDAVIGGLQPTLTILGALPGVGKSGLLAAIIRNLSAKGVKVGVFSLEDSREWINERITAEASKVPLFVLKNRPLTKGQMERVSAFLEVLHGRARHVVCDDRPGLTAAEVVASARDMMTRHGVKALLVDHLGEIRLTRSDRHDLDIADALQQLRALAKTYRVPVVVACHLRRREGLTPKDEPRLTDFAFSAAVERMARVGLALSKPNEEALMVHVLKQTSGKSGVAVELQFDAPAGIVSNAEAPNVRRAAASLYERAE